MFVFPHKVSRSRNAGGAGMALIIIDPASAQKDPLSSEQLPRNMAEWGLRK